MSNGKEEVPAAPERELTTAGSHIATERGYDGAGIVEPGEPVAPGIPVSDEWMKPADPLDHDGDGRKGGSKKGAAATAAKPDAKE